MKTNPDETVVIGAGAVGLSVATHLARRGVAVTVVDEMPPGSGASYGNAGFLVPDTAMPLALPGMYKKVPGWLLDPEGPLVLRPRYLPTAAPFLFKWLAASHLKQVYFSSAAIRQLHKHSFEHWLEIVGVHASGDLIRRAGQVYIWEGAGRFETPVEDELRARNAVKVELISIDDLRKMFPGISTNVGRALLIPGNGHTINPGRLLNEVLKQLRQANGKFEQARVFKIWPDAQGGWRVMTNDSTRKYGAVVVAAGAWSARLLKPLGIRIPLESERGYHVMLSEPSVKLAYPILHKTGYFGMNSMETGLRLAGTVEFAGLEAEPDTTRCDVLIRQALKLFPKLEYGETQYWMGHRPTTPDSLPVIGPVKKHPGLYLCFGHNHCGMTSGPTSGKLLAELMTGVSPHIDPTPYGAERFD